MSAEETSTQVIRKIQAKDSKYRLFFVVLMILVLVAMGGVILLQAAALQEFRGQSAERAASLKKLQRDNLDASGRTNAYLQCLARFFAESDRADLTLTDLDKCSYERAGSVVPGVDVTPTGTPTNEQTTAGSAPASSDPGPSSPTAPPQASSSPPPLTVVPAVPTAPNLLRVLDIHGCIILVNICVNQ